MVKNLPAMQKTQVWSWVEKILGRREWLPTPVFVPVEFHGQRRLPGYSPWGHKELDMTERLIHTHTLRYLPQNPPLGDLKNTEMFLFFFLSKLETHHRGGKTKSALAVRGHESQGVCQDNNCGRY